MIQAAAATFTIGTQQALGEKSFNLTGAPIHAVHSPVKITVTLLRDETETVCLIAQHLLGNSPALYREIQRVVRKTCGVSEDRVSVFSSHNHTAPLLTINEPASAEWGEGKRHGRVELSSTGREYFTALKRTLEVLPKRMQAVTIWWALGFEGRISYNRKGRRADGSTYFMRESDRRLIGKDFHGDIDKEAPVVCLKNQEGHPVSFLTSFAAHPVTAFHPERPCVFGEYPQIACDLLEKRYGDELGITPVSFLQGCAGDINAKGFLSGDVARATRYGQRLGGTYLGTLKKLQLSRTDRLGFQRIAVRVPLAALPSMRTLRSEMDEIRAFLRRANNGEEDTLSCLGLNLPREVSPKYRGALVEPLRQWNTWARRMRTSGRVEAVPKHIEMMTDVIRLGDVAIVGMPCEPFVGVGRQIRQGSPAELTIPCGYTNVSYGYVPDGPNVGDQEYMSAFFHYTRRPDYRRPGGNVLAQAAVRRLNKLF